MIASPPVDEDVKSLNRALFDEKLKEVFVPREFRLYTIRDASGVLFDVYLLDEDGIFLGVTPSVPEEKVIEVGIELMQEHAWWSARS